MITIRTGAYSNDDLLFLASVLEDGLKKNCFAFSTLNNVHACEECKNKIACREALSALHHVYAVYYNKEAKIKNGK